MFARRKGILMISFAILLFLLFVFLSNSSNQTLAITNSSKFTLTLYKATQEDSLTSYNKNHIVISGSSPHIYHVRKGQYVYVISSDSKDYQPRVYPLTVAGNPIAIAIPSLDYTQSKLTGLLATESPSIKKVLSLKYPSQMQTYSIANQKLYKDGTWYGAKLVPSDPSLDVMRVILMKVNGSWQVATDPPEILLSSPLYPKIPQEILADVDNFL
jgi:hypothetical protein